MNTHPFNGPFSGTTQVSRYEKGKTNLHFSEARDSEWQWHQLGHMQVCTSLQTDNHTSTPPLCFLQAGCPSCRPTNCIKALKAKQHQNTEGYRERKCAKNYNKWHHFFSFFSTAIDILVISHHNSFRVLFDKLASVYFICNMYECFITENESNDQSSKPALCQLHRCTFIPNVLLTSLCYIYLWYKNLS